MRPSGDVARLTVCETSSATHGFIVRYNFVKAHGSVPKQGWVATLNHRQGVLRDASDRRAGPDVC
ncbi:hypothetical protein SBA4_790021 [Candidatus Sulfopaludibacter sp. SbA4]|nr:hypothetical protein SBA4_790021 [Candidatus Sulfopaludibacter sp. SbA4]